jgi:16S rRNA (uracil1498-N3)-methyltransferase
VTHIRVFAPAGEQPTPGVSIELEEDESHYLIKVRRARVGQVVELFDPRGTVWSATVVAEGRRAALRVHEPMPCSDPDERVLLLGLPDPTAALEALVGACEAGASEVVLVACARSQGTVPARSRIERILRAAQRQCGRPRVPAVLGVEGPWPLARALEHRPELPGWFAWERHADSAGPEAAPHGGLRLLVGPEGGFTSEEVEQIVASGLQALSLGPWILRTPTAAVALLARAWTGSVRAGR